jgi:uncharacterized protein (TIGR02996 family)
MEQAAFLSLLAANPADQTTWLVYADWLADRDDPTADLIRTSLAIFHSPNADAERDAQCAEWRRLFAVASLDVLPLLGRYASSLPVRFRVGPAVEDGIHRVLGEKKLSALTGRVEVGTLARGAMVGVRTGSRVRTRKVRSIRISPSRTEEVVESGLCIPDEFAVHNSVTVLIAAVDDNLLECVIGPAPDG